MAHEIWHHSPEHYWLKCRQNDCGRSHGFRSGECVKGDIAQKYSGPATLSYHTLKCVSVQSRNTVYCASTLPSGRYPYLTSLLAVPSEASDRTESIRRCKLAVLLPNMSYGQKRFLSPELSMCDNANA